MGTWKKSRLAYIRSHVNHLSDAPPVFDKLSNVEMGDANGGFTELFQITNDQEISVWKLATSDYLVDSLVSPQ